jgi:hypothetical protein
MLIEYRLLPFNIYLPEEANCRQQTERSYGLPGPKNANYRVVLYTDRMKGSIRAAMEKMQERQELRMAYTRSGA